MKKKFYKKINKIEYNFNNSEVSDVTLFNLLIKHTFNNFNKQKNESKK